MYVDHLHMTGSIVVFWKSKFSGEYERYKLSRSRVKK